MTVATETGTKIPPVQGIGRFSSSLQTLKIGNFVFLADIPLIHPLSYHRTQNPKVKNFEGTTLNE